jgi:pyridoxine/pyridoxamine 5'-phosphate oxidase
MGTFTTEPPRGRPDSPPPSYGVPRRGGEFVPWERVVERLRSAEAYWLATVTPSGRPHVVPIWGVFVDDELYLETGAPGTIKNRNLASNPEVAVHLDGINDAVIVRGVASAVRPDPVLGGALAAAFAAKYEGYNPAPDSWERGGLYRIDPRTLLAWQAMPTSTRWTFDRK